MALTFNAIDDPYGAATTTWADLMAMQDFYESDDFAGSFQPILSTGVVLATSTGVPLQALLLTPSSTHTKTK